jgi:hypothetical protein
MTSDDSQHDSLSPATTAVSPHGDDVLDKFYAPIKGTIYDRFPGKVGLDLEELCFKIYQVGPEITLPFFDKSDPPCRMLVDHHLNQRDMEVIVEEYAESIETYGNAPSCRGAPWAQLSRGDQPPYRMVSYRQLSAAVYLAWEKCGTKNHLVQRSIEQGLPRARILNSRTPDDVIDFLRDWSNGFEAGNITFLQCILELPKQIAEWDVYAATHRLTARGCGDDEAVVESGTSTSWEARRWAWLQERWEVAKRKVVPSQNSLRDLKAFTNKLKEWNLTDSFEAVMKKTCRFHEPRLDTGATFSNFHQCVVTLDKVVSTMGMSDLHIVFVELAQMIVPSIRSN